MRSVEFGLRGLESFQLQEPPRDSRRSLNPESKKRVELLQYLAGYFDASGSVSISRANSSYYLRLDIGRMDPSVVNLVHTMFGGKRSERELLGSENLGVRHRWYAQAETAHTVLDALAPHLRLKKKQAALAQEFAQMESSRKNKDMREDYKIRMTDLNNQSSVEIEEPLSSAYLAGFFDAHGLLKVDHSSSTKTGVLSVVMSVENDELRRVIVSQTGGHTYEGYNIVGLFAHDAKRFLEEVLPFTIIHKKVAALGIAFQNMKQSLSHDEITRRQAMLEPIVALFYDELAKLPKKKFSKHERRRTIFPQE